ncbi:dynein light intermediate chain-domain-containing protein [Lipomyces oligophaga]|uniref:dynein light intermediate chain-domain-containing protein n=1 Tax=Lipomyces oligophaga TaxID=45792 RepID=UPI0034CD0C8E
MADLWLSLLKSAARKKEINTRTLWILGGSNLLRKQFIDKLIDSAKSKSFFVQSSAETQVNSFGLSYAYADIYDREHEELILRLNIYTLSSVAETLAPLLVDLLKRDETMLEDLLVVLLGDWDEPRRLIRDLAHSILFLRDKIFTTLDPEIKSRALQICSNRYQRLHNISFTETYQPSSKLSGIEMPLGMGELDAPLGVDIAVAVMNADHIDILERKYGRKDDEFDFIQQFLRTILLKHGASLIYLSTESHQLFTFIHYLISPSLESDMSRDLVVETSRQVKPNVVDREAVLIPSGWDSWSKILVIKGSFDADGVSSSWTSEVLGDEGEQASVIEVYEEVVHAFGGKPIGLYKEDEEGIEIKPLSSQEFLKSQLNELNSIEAK